MRTQNKSTIDVETSKFSEVKKKFIYYVNLATTFFGIYVIWILIHYISAHLYVRYCVPYTITGFLISPFISLTPPCIAIRWCIINGGISILNMWNTLGLWFMKHLVHL